MATEQLSVVALDHESREVVGVFLNEDYASPDPPGLTEFFSARPDINPKANLTAIAELEDKLNEAHGIPSEPVDRPRGKWFHLWMVGVSPKARGRGVASKLVEYSLVLAKGLGYDLAFAECTGA
jgi:ribosomal protein S18 acetylase RimI-like enzyme